RLLLGSPQDVERSVESLLRLTAKLQAFAGVLLTLEEEGHFRRDNSLGGPAHAGPERIHRGLGLGPEDAGNPLRIEALLEQQPLEFLHIRASGTTLHSPPEGPRVFGLGRLQRPTNTPPARFPVAEVQVVGATDKVDSVVALVKICSRVEFAL